MSGERASLVSFIILFLIDKTFNVQKRQTQISGGEEVGIEKLGYIDALHIGHHPKENQQMQL